MASSAMAYMIMVLLWPTKWRWLGILAGSVYIAAIGLSRMYFGLHYPTDIVGGWIVSGTWVAIVLLVIKIIPRHG